MSQIINTNPTSVEPKLSTEVLNGKLSNPFIGLSYGVKELYHDRGWSFL